jgi:tetratricopeptide (TPR) repeat protein
MPVAAAAAVLAVIALAWLLLFQPVDASKVADRYIRQDLTVLPVKMGRSDSLQTGILLYNSGDFPGALHHFEYELRLDSVNPTALFYAGVVSLRMENYDKALTLFIRLETHTDPHVNPALFYEALTLMRRNRAGDADHAKQLFRRIVQEDLSKKGDAQELLSKL